MGRGRRPDGPSVHGDDAAAHVRQLTDGKQHIRVVVARYNNIVGVMGNGRRYGPSREPIAFQNPDTEFPCPLVPLNDRDLGQAGIQRGLEASRVIGLHLADEALRNEGGGLNADDTGFSGTDRQGQGILGQRLEVDGVGRRSRSRVIQRDEDASVFGDQASRREYLGARGMP